MLRRLLRPTVVGTPDEGAHMAHDTPNILVIWGDDIGMTNLSCYSDGLMGYRTPNIDRIADEGMRFTDWYGEQSCTAGRSAFITGQSVFRTGLSKVGIPGSPVGMRPEDPTIAGLLKARSYATGRFGKNHLGDKDEHLPTNHGFDEFFGNLYHLNAEEEPELPDYPPARGLPPFQGALRPPRRPPLVGERRRDAADRGHRPADQEADGDHRR
jgi:arylsulfatase